MRICCTNCGLEFDLPGDDWQDAVACPKCRADVLLPQVKTVKLTDVPQLSPPGGEQRPTTLREDEVLAAGVLIGPYLIEAYVGRGGMGTVYRAKHTMLGRVVALKVLPEKFARDPEFVQRFRREAQALANLAHPNIVAVHDLGVQGDIYYFAMEFVGGVNLRDVLAHKKLSPEEALKIVPQLCEALEYAHAQGVIHRDIKPENILVDKGGRAKIADFGLAKIVRGETTAVPLTRTNVVMGTVEYMAPEQRENLKQVDHRADIFSLGVVLYEMLTGQLPVGKFEPPSKRVQVDVRIDDVVLKALERDPDQRYQRASHMGTAVSQVGTGALRDLPKKLTRSQREKIGVYIIVNLALFLFFGLVAGNLIAPLIIAIFWGMALAIDVWKKHVHGETPQEPSPEAPSAGPNVSAIVVLGFLTALLASLTGVAVAILYWVDHESATLEIGWSMLREIRVGEIATAYAAALLSVIGFFLSVAGSAHVWRSQRALRGRPLAQAGILLSLAPVVFIVAVIFPKHEALHRETVEVRTTAERFGTLVRDSRWEEAYHDLSRDTRNRMSLEEFRSKGEKLHDSVNYNDLCARNVVVFPNGERAAFSFGRYGYEAGRFTAVREPEGWRILDPITEREGQR